MCTALSSVPQVPPTPHSGVQILSVIITSERLSCKLHTFWNILSKLATGSYPLCYYPKS